MTNQTLPRTPHEFGRIYHDHYIGRSESAEQCAHRFGYASGMSFTIHCRKFGLRLRTHSEALQAIPEAGQPWEWPKETPGQAWMWPARPKVHREARS